MRSTPLLALALLVWMVNLAAAAPPPIVTDVQPRSVQPGAADVELIITGKELSGVTQVAIPNSAGIEAKVIGTPSADQVMLHVNVAKDALTGFRELRLISAGGVSNPLRLRISLYPSVAEKEPSSSQHPQRVKLPALITGRLNEPGDRDVFQFDAVKSQTLIFHVHGERFSPRIDPVISLYDSRSHEVAASDNHHGMDPMLAFVVPADGTYTLELRDVEYRGGAGLDYQVEAGPIPYLQGVFPPLAQRGRSGELQAIGFNLERSIRIPFDLNDQGVERHQVRANTPAGETNAVTIDVVATPMVVEAETGDSPGQEQTLPLSGAMAGRIDRDADVDSFRFTVSAKQRYDLQVRAREFGSPLDALLTLRNANNEVIERNDDGGEGFDARIMRELEPGDYIASITDLTRSGGDAFTYALSLAAATEPRQDFAVRFLPDTPRVHRGGRTQMWAEVTREGFKGDLTLKLLNAPAGVTIEPATLSTETSGIFTIAAAEDAQLGTTPIQIEITGKIGRKSVKRAGVPEHEQRIVEQAYVTVLEAAPFRVLPLAEADDEDGGENPYRGIARLEREMEQSTPELESQQRDWESRVVTDAAWHVLKFEDMQATGGTSLQMQGDGAILAGGENPDKSTYTLTTTAPAEGIAVLRLEAMPDDSLAAKGPGRAPNGNFVLSHLKVTAAPKDHPGQSRDVKLTDANAEFAQDKWPVANALDSNPANGWATSPRFGQVNSATFKLAEPIAACSITITLAHASPHKQHTLGRFRLSVSADGGAVDRPGVPADVLAIVQTPAEKRTEEQAAKLAMHYRTIAPSLQPVREQLTMLRKDAAAFPPVTAKKEKTTLEVMVHRAGDFEGPVKVSLEGFVTGRGGNGEPAPINGSLDVKPITLKDKDMRGTLTISAKNTSQTGTRMVILRAESKVGGETIVNDSKPFPLTVNN